MQRVVLHTGFVLLLISLALVKVSFGQGTDISFGKNRVQVKEFNWRFYRANEFDIYHYTGGKDLARFVGKHANKQLDKIEEILDYRAKNRLVFIVYNSYADLRQTNIGYSKKKDDPSGRTPIIDNHAFLYFNGNHFDLINQIRESIAQVLLNEMLYGGSIQERVQNATLLNLPDWYLKGLTEYLGQPMSIEERTKLKSGVLSGRFENFQHLSKRNQTLISQAIWKYIADVYGETSITNIIYLNRVNKSLESGFVFVLGKDYNEVFSEWYEYARRQFKQEKESFPGDRLSFKEKPESLEDGQVTQLKMGPKGRKLAYVTNEMGKKRVWIYDFETEDHDKVYQTGYKTNVLETDDNYPIIAWRPVENQLTIVDDKASTAVFMQYDPEEEEIVKERKNFRVEKVLDISYSRDGRFIALSGIKQGNSDIYVLNWQTNSMIPVTQDIYDDFHPAFTEKGNAVVFSSNRADDTLKQNNRWNMSGFNDNFDIFYSRYKDRNKELKRLTFSGSSDEFHPDVYDSTYFSYLTAENGIVNRDASRLDSIFNYSRVIAKYEDTARYPADTFIFKEKDTADIFIPDLAFKDTGIQSIDTTFFYKDTAYTYTLTNRPNNILFYDVNRKTGKVNEFYKIKGKFKRAQYPIPDSIPGEVTERSETDFASTLNEDIKRRQESPLVENLFKQKKTPADKPTDTKKESKPKSDTGGVDIDDYYFQSKFKKESEKSSKKDKSNIDQKEGKNSVDKQKLAARKAREKEKALLGDARPYYLSFTPTFLQTQLDNSIINSKYLPYNQSDPDPFVYNPVLNMMFTMGVSDLFQDYRINGGFRILGNLKGADYFIRYHNLKNRLDQKLTFYRHGEKKQFDNGTKKKQETSHELKYQIKWPFSEKSSIRAEVFGRRDNDILLSSERSTLTEPNDIQNWMGINFEYVFDNTRELGKNIRSGARMKFYAEGFRSFKFEGEVDNKLFSVVGGDVRGYVPIFRDMVWANRLAFASSIGQAKVVYFMGGVDNWLFPKFNDDIQVSKDQNYVYKALASNLRGFGQNIRNGNSYSLFNTELRIPVFKMLQKKPIMSNFFKNFQLVGFGDIGSAWTGTNPFGEDNALNRKTYENPPLKISVVNLSNPVVGGAGIGFRTKLLGYFVRVDHAWGFENYQFRKEGITYLSLGMDF